MPSECVDRSSSGNHLAAVCHAATNQKLLASFDRDALSITDANRSSDSVLVLGNGTISGFVKCLYALEL